MDQRNQHQLPPLSTLLGSTLLEGHTDGHQQHKHHPNSLTNPPTFTDDSLVPMEPPVDLAARSQLCDFRLSPHHHHNDQNVTPSVVSTATGTPFSARLTPSALSGDSSSPLSPLTPLILSSRPALKIPRPKRGRRQKYPHMTDKERRELRASQNREATKRSRAKQKVTVLERRLSEATTEEEQAGLELEIKKTRAIFQPRHELMRISAIVDE